MQSSAVVFRKQAESPDAIERLSIEASILKAVAHPNVVEVLGIHVTADKASLRLAEVDAESLGEVSLSARDFGTVLMSAAATLACIHGAGVAHGAINDIHLLVRSSDKTVVLCGFGDAIFTTDEIVQSRDVVALAELLNAHLNHLRDPLRARINGHVEPDAEFVRSLQSEADLAASGEMTASEFAESLRSVLETSSGHKEVKAIAPHTSNKRRRLKIVAAVVVPLAFIATGLSLGSKSDHKALAGTPTVNTYCQQVASTATAIDTDNDGCPNGVTIGNGVVTVDDQRYTVGNPDDKVVIGDWTGNGASTLALLRSSTGEVYLFDAWPAIGQTADPRLIATVPGATAITKLSKGSREVLKITSPTGVTTVDPKAVTQ